MHEIVGLFIILVSKITDENAKTHPSSLTAAPCRESSISMLSIRLRGLEGRGVIDPQRVRCQISSELLSVG